MNAHGTAMAIALTSALASGTAFAQPDRGIFMVVSAASYHTRTEDPMNEFNPGVGLGLRLNEAVDVVAGTYRNSYSAQSHYAIGRWRINNDTDPVAIHACGGYLDGYAGHAEGYEDAGASPVGFAVDVQYGPLLLIGAPAPRQRGFVLSLWLVFDGWRY